MNNQVFPTMESRRPAFVDWDEFEALWADQQTVLKPAARRSLDPFEQADRAERDRQMSLDFLHALVMG
jgi:hypothetical protein